MANSKTRQKREHKLLAKERAKEKERNRKQKEKDLLKYSLGL